MPVEQQNEIAKRQFKNLEKLWARVCALAAKKNCILVFAAGNDDILSSIPPENRNASSIVVAAVDKNLYPTDFTNYICVQIYRHQVRVFTVRIRMAISSPLTELVWLLR